MHPPMEGMDIIHIWPILHMQRILMVLMAMAEAMAVDMVLVEGLVEVLAMAEAWEEDGSKFCNPIKYKKRKFPLGIIKKEKNMFYRNYPYRGGFYPGAPPSGVGYPMEGPWNYPYGDMGNIPYYPPYWGHGGPGPAIPPFYQPNYPQQGMFPWQGMPPFPSPIAPEQEIEMLRGEAKMLKERIDQIDSRISDLETHSNKQ